MSVFIVKICIRNLHKMYKMQILSNLRINLMQSLPQSWVLFRSIQIKSICWLVWKLWQTILLNVLRAWSRSKRKNKTLRNNLIGQYVLELMQPIPNPGKLQWQRNSITRLKLMTKDVMDIHSIQIAENCC